MTYPDRYRYRVELEPLGTYRYVFPELDEACFSAKTLREGREALQEHVLQALEERLKAKNPPEPHRPHAGEGVLELTPTYRAKLLLIAAAEEHGVSAAELARRLGVAPQEAQRLLRLTHPTKIDTLAAALSAVGYRLQLSAEPLFERL